MVHELFKDDFIIDTNAYNMPNVKNKRKEILGPPQP